jgi:hypothetical protein
MRYREIISAVLLFLMTGAAAFGMGQKGQQPESQPTATTGSQGQQQHVSINDILGNPLSFSGRSVLIQGRFRGWTSPCPQSAMITRSDWVMDDGKGCIYVTGQLPTGLSPEKPSGEQTTVTGIVEIKVGRPVIRAMTITTNGQ